MFVAEPNAADASVSASATDLTSSDSWRELVGSVEPFLGQVSRRLEEQVATFDPEIAPYAHYALTNQGKQLRPALVALSNGVFGKPDERLVTLAVIVEMIHLATLVHDDIMDEARIRRRRPTLAANWGNQISVLLGDSLFAHALKLTAGFPTTEVCRAVSAATKTVCAGEILQTNRQGHFEMSRSEYFRILQMKTGELFALSCDLGAWLASAKPDERAALSTYGANLGTAYQLFDDCVDIFGREKEAGKSLGTDLANGKLTLPVLITLEKSEGDDRQNLLQMLNAWDSASIDPFHDLLGRYGALSESQAVIGSFLNTAQTAISDLPDSPCRKALMGLTSFLARQSASLAT